MTDRTAPKWWPPAIGTKLRKIDRVERGTIARLLHVVSVFEHGDDVHAVVAFFGTHKQWWHYEVIDTCDITCGPPLWLDGEEPPEQWQRDQLAASSAGR